MEGPAAEPEAEGREEVEVAELERVEGPEPPAGPSPVSHDAPDDGTPRSEKEPAP